MAIPKNKQELLRAILDSYTKLIHEVVTIPYDLTDKKELEGHSKNTVMNITNLLSYLVGWQQLVLKWYTKKNQGLEVDFPETGFKWNELGQLAQKFYIDYEEDTTETLIAKLEKSTSEIVAIIESKSDFELYETPWYDKWPLGKMIQLNTSSPLKNATQRIRKWKKMKQLH